MIKLIIPFGLCSIGGVVYYLYKKICGEKQYKIIKDYEYKTLRIQLIKNPQNNVCPHCFDILEENEEICRYPACDHHFCEKCIHEQVDESQKNLKAIDKPITHPCTMCMSDSKIVIG